MTLGVLAAILVGAYVYMPRSHPPVVVGVMEIRARGGTPPWMCDFTRDALNTVLSKIDDVHVFSQQKIDLLRRKQHLTGIEAAEKLGIVKMISGTISTTDQNLILDVELVDITSGLLEAKRSVRAPEAQLVEMQNRAVTEIVNALHVGLGPDKLNALLAGRTNDQLDSYKLLTETMGGFVDVKEKPKAAPSEPKAPATSWMAPWPASAYADDSDQLAVRQLLERYRTALEAKDLNQLTAIHIAMNEGMREALARYFTAADQLKVQFSNFDILVEGDEAVATFTRNDDFKDSRSGRDMHLEIRVSSVIAKQEGAWKIRGLKKPS
jgi:ketosteroid isomerase-like protein/TolB-like protein